MHVPPPLRNKAEPAAAEIAGEIVLAAKAAAAPQPTAPAQRRMVDNTKPLFITYERRNM
jgi:hypothetical protein